MIYCISGQVDGQTYVASMTAKRKHQKDVCEHIQTMLRGVKPGADVRAWRCGVRDRHIELDNDKWSV